MYDPNATSTFVDLRATINAQELEREDVVIMIRDRLLLLDPTFFQSQKAHTDRRDTFYQEDYWLLEGMSAMFAQNAGVGYIDTSINIDKVIGSYGRSDEITIRLPEESIVKLVESPYVVSDDQSQHSINVNGLKEVVCNGHAENEIAYRCQIYINPPVMKRLHSDHIYQLLYDLQCIIIEQNKIVESDPPTVTLDQFFGFRSATPGPPVLSDLEILIEKSIILKDRVVFINEVNEVSLITRELTNSSNRFNGKVLGLDPELRLQKLIDCFSDIWAIIKLNTGGSLSYATMSEIKGATTTTGHNLTQKVTEAVNTLYYSILFQLTSKSWIINDVRKTFTYHFFLFLYVSL